MHLYFKGVYGLSDRFPTTLEEQVSFVVPAEEGKPEVRVDVFPAKKCIESSQLADASKKLYMVLKTGNYRDAPEDVKTRLLQIDFGIRESTQKVYSLLKYYLNYDGIPEAIIPEYYQSCQNFYWSEDNLAWKKVPLAPVPLLGPKSHRELDETTAKRIQTLLDEDFEPFVALRHLHRAKEETNPRFMWIDATIAAELAIKEFLIKKNPLIEEILLECPSPPLNKLYGQILNTYAGERSPYIKQITKGAEIRNKLVHRPQDTVIQVSEAVRYVDQIETAIFHLLRLLYPKDENYARLYEESKYSVSK